MKFKQDAKNLYDQISFFWIILEERRHQRTECKRRPSLSGGESVSTRETRQYAWNFVEIPSSLAETCHYAWKFVEIPSPLAETCHYAERVVEIPFPLAEKNSYFMLNMEIPSPFAEYLCTLKRIYKRSKSSCQPGGHEASPGRPDTLLSLLLL